jgi:uncharacterized damage-inducible protein DinB
MDSKNLIAELEFELISTAKLLHLVPEDKLEWQPHPRAMTLGQLAFHVAAIPGRYLQFGEEGTTTLDALSYHQTPKDKEEILMAFGDSRAAAEKRLRNDDGDWDSKTWQLTKDGSAVFTLDLPTYIRLLIFNHLIHHRGQLSSYLRILNILVPSIYGPSADENPFA